MLRSSDLIVLSWLCRLRHIHSSVSFLTCIMDTDDLYDLPGTDFTVPPDGTNNAILCCALYGSLSQNTDKAETSGQASRRLSSAMLNRNTELSYSKLELLHKQDFICNHLFRYKTYFISADLRFKGCVHLNKLCVNLTLFKLDCLKKCQPQGTNHT